MNPIDTKTHTDKKNEEKKKTQNWMGTDDTEQFSMFP